MASKNLVLKGATWNGVESVDFPVSGGGTARYVETSDADATASDIASGKKAYVNGSLITGTASGGGGSWSWMGRNPTKLQEWTETSSFADLGFDEWTYGTTATTLRAAQNLSTTVSIDVTQYDLVLLTKLCVTYDYGNWTPSSAMDVFALSGVYVTSGSFTSKSSATSGTPSNYSGGSLYNDYKAANWSSSGVNTGYGANTYGLYSSNVASASSTGTTDLTVTVRTPVIYARGSSSYFTQTAFENVDMDKSMYELAIEAWRVDIGTSVKSFVLGETANIINNGLVVS